jgi:hypothetical protein
LETEWETCDGAERVVDCMPTRTGATDLVRAGSSNTEGTPGQGSRGTGGACDLPSFGGGLGHRARRWHRSQSRPAEALLRMCVTRLPQWAQLGEVGAPPQLSLVVPGDLTRTLARRGEIAAVGRGAISEARSKS